MNKLSKNIVIILVIAIIIVSVLGIYLYNREHGINKGANIEETVSIDDFKTKLEENKIEIQEESESSDFSSIGAMQGKTFSISDEKIQVYKFDPNSTDELASSNLKNARENGKIVLPNFDNIEINVIYRKGLILSNYENHPDKDKIIEIFNNL